jgi:hypothetical protein
MEKEALRQLIREELNKLILEDFPIKLSKITLEPNEFLIVKVEGELDNTFYKNTQAVLAEYFGKRALVMGSTKQYHIEIVKGVTKND